MLVKEKKISCTNATAVKREVIAAARAGDAVLDLSAVEALDSSAVAIVLAWIRVLQEKNAAPVLQGVPEKLLTLARLYGVKGLIEPFASAPGAKQSARG